MSDVADHNEAYTSPKVQVKTSYAIRQTLLKSVGYVLGILVVVIVFYLGCIVTTAARFVVTDSVGVVLTKDPDLRSGAIPKNTHIIARINDNRDMLANPLSKLTLGTTLQSDVSTMRIVAGPAGRLTLSSDGKLLYDDVATKTKVPASMPDRGWLTNQYLVVCTGGSCHKGNTYVIDKKDILGQIVNSDKG
jgi:hypothetical protein